jgi:hypothetical protein
MALMIAPRSLREKLGDEAVEALIELLNKSEEKIKADVIIFSEDKYERRLSEETGKITVEMAGLRFELKEDIAGLRAELKEDIAGLRAELKEDIAGVRTELSGKISSSYASLIKWMFIFWLGQIGAIIGILFAFFQR